MKNKYAYLAGYIDGDGCLYIGTYIQKPKNIIVYDCSIQISSVCLQVIQYFKAEHSGSYRKMPFRQRHRDAYCWTIKGQQARKIAEACFQFMTDKQISASYFIKVLYSIKFNKFRQVNYFLHIYRQYFINKIKQEKHMNNWVTEEKVRNIGTRNTVKPSEENFAYLAGLIDAEGCFRIGKFKRRGKPNYDYSIRLEIGNTRFPIFPWLFARFGGAISLTKASTRKKACATWTLTAFALSQLIPKILPYLRVKKEAAIKLMEFYDTTLPNGGDRHSDEFKKAYQCTIEKREEIISEIHKLNLKGIKV